MILVLPFCSGDVVITRLWLRWAERLGRCPEHDAILVADAGLSYRETLEFLDKSNAIFNRVSIVSPEQSVIGWPAGPNLMFKTVARYIQDHVKKPWFWCEPDAIPLRSGWLTEIESAYYKCGKDFMGAIVPCKNPDLPRFHLNGNAVYPADAAEVLEPFCARSAWDVASAEVVVRRAANTSLIQHFYGEERLAPTFLAQKGDGCPINAFTPDQISADAAVFHRCKDGTLIRLLWQKQFPAERVTDEFIVVLPFCNRDAGLAIKNAEWMAKLSSAQRYDCLLTYDATTIMQYVHGMKEAARRAFRSVQMFRYPAPPKPGWPAAPNWAFQNTARHIHAALRRPWLWLEYDAIPLCPNWIEVLQEDYAMCGRSFYGPIVPGMGHMNGVSIYPADAATRLPTAMKATDMAWDAICRADMGDDVHDASNRIQHFWGVVNGKPHINTGNAPTFRTKADVARWVAPGAVILHRCKDGSLIDRLST